MAFRKAFQDQGLKKKTNTPSNGDILSWPGRWMPARRFQECLHKYISKQNPNTRHDPNLYIRRAQVSSAWRHSSNNYLMDLCGYKNYQTTVLDRTIDREDALNKN